MAAQYLDGKGFAEAVVAGADWVLHTREHLNRINVFPVADGDTGTNMALSLSATAAGLRASEEMSLAKVAEQAAQASILGAKGNSGVIMAHWFLGLRKAFEGCERVDTTQLSAALVSATDYVYDGMEEPVEGTIITVMKAVSEHAKTLVGTEKSQLAAFFTSLCDAAERALAETPNQLAALKEADVVDAGAQGFVNFLQGALRAMLGKPLPELSSEQLHDGAAVAALHENADLSHRYCTEVIVRGRGYEAERLRGRFRALGSSMLVVTTGDVFKLHIHTDHPDAIMAAASKLGTIEERKVDDMLRQRDERASGAVTALTPLHEQPNSVAVLCDSTADLDAAVRREHAIEIAPLQVLFGDQVFRDQVDLSTEEFYERLARKDAHPTTSQPPPREFVEALERVNPQREAVILTLSGTLSGTAKSARHGASLAPHPRVEIFDSKTTSLGLGMITLNAARLAQRGVSMDELLHWLGRWRAESGLVFCVATLEYLLRGGRIGRAQSALGNLLGLRPILSLRDGEVVPIARTRARDALNKVLANLRERLPDGSKVRLGLISIGANEELEAVEADVRARCEVIEVIRGAPTGVIGVHAGPGAWGIFYQKVQNDDPLLTPA